MVNSNANVEKSRFFTFLVYPDSVLLDWQQRLELLGLPMAISPLHDKDLDVKLAKEYKATVDELKSKTEALTQEESSLLTDLENKLKTKIYKKPHYHVIYIAKNPVTAQAVRNRLKRTLGDNAINRVQIIRTSVSNTYLYLTHESKDAVAKKKHKYDSKDIVLMNNFDISRYDVMDVETKKFVFNKLLDLIRVKRLANVIELERFIEEHGEGYDITVYQLREAIESKSGILRLYFDGAYQEAKKHSEEKERKRLEEAQKEFDEKCKIIANEMKELEN